MRDCSIRIFVSYAHADTAWRDALFSRSLDTPLGLLDAWTDDRIEAGASWDEAIERALGEATVALLLVSRHFLSSVYIERKELPTLLKKRVSEGLRLLWIPIGDIDLAECGELAGIQSASPLSKPLSALPSTNAEVFDRVRQEARQRIEAAIDPIGVPLKRSLGERYGELELIGGSDISMVYRAYDRDLRRQVAVKASVEGRQANRFVDFVRDAVKFADAPNFVSIYDCVVDRQPRYCLMQHIEGQSLRKWIAADGRRDLAIVIRILSRITTALAALHDQGMAYGNLKPSNIVLAKDNEPYLLPMGRRVDECRGAKALDEWESRHPTPEDIAYLTPEQFDAELATVRPQLSDQYMLGLLAYELITGALPPAIADRETPPVAMVAIRARLGAAFSALPLVSIARPECPEAIATMIQTMTHRNPAQRYESLDKLLLEVRRQEDVALNAVRDSLKRCLKERGPAGQIFFEAVYDAFFGRRKDATDLFKNVKEQYKVLESAVAGLIAFYDQERARHPNEPNVLSRTAEKHARIGLDFYAPFVESLIDSVCGIETSAGFAFDPQCRQGEIRRSQIRSAWVEVVRPGVTYMMGRYSPQ